jgi:hypothetical protein
MVQISEKWANVPRFKLSEVVQGNTGVEWLLSLVPDKVAQGNTGLEMALQCTT